MSTRLSTLREVAAHGLSTFIHRFHSGQSTLRLRFPFHEIPSYHLCRWPIFNVVQLRGTRRGARARHHRPDKCKSMAWSATGSDSLVCPAANRSRTARGCRLYRTPGRSWSPAPLIRSTPVDSYRQGHYYRSGSIDHPVMPSYRTEYGCVDQWQGIPPPSKHFSDITTYH